MSWSNRALRRHAATSIALVCLAEFLIPSAVADVDIGPTVESGRIKTNGWSDDDATFIPDVRAFAYAFDDPGPPPGTTDPGINSEGSALPAGMPLSFNIVDASTFLTPLPGNLTYWDGTGAVGFGAVPGGEGIKLTHPVIGSRTVTVSGALGPQSGFLIDTADADGLIHVHLNAELEGASPAIGLYLFGLELTAPGVAESAPTFLIYNYGLENPLDPTLDPPQIDMALAWANAHLVPEPASALLAGLAAALLVDNRRRRNR